MSDNQENFAPDHHLHPLTNRMSCFFTCTSLVYTIHTCIEFPILMFRNGGLLFMGLYVIFLAVLAMPLFMAEFSIGQFRGASILNTWNMAPISIGFGMALFMCAMLRLCYYPAIAAYAFHYCIQSFSFKLPWRDCEALNTLPENSSRLCIAPDNYKQLQCNIQIYKLFNEYAPSETGISLRHCGMTKKFSEQTIVETLTKQCRDHRLESPAAYYRLYVLNLAESFYDNISISSDMIVAFVSTWLFIALWAFRGIFSIHQASGWIISAATLALTTVAAVICYIESARDGLRDIMFFNFDALGSMTTYVEAAKLSVKSYAIGTGTGIIIGAKCRYSSDSLQWAHLLLPAVLLFYNVMGSLVVYGVYGFLSVQRGSCMTDLVGSYGDFVFVHFPAAVSQMGFSNAWNFFFFAAIFVSVVSPAAFDVAIVYNALETFSWFSLNENCIMLMMFFVFIILSFAALSNYGPFLTVVIDQMAFSQYIEIILPLIESIILMWIYTVGRMQFDISFMYGRNISSVCKFCWMIMPSAFAVIGWMHIKVFQPVSLGFPIEFSTELNRIGLFLFAVVICEIIIGAVGSVVYYVKRPIQPFLPDEFWEPCDPERLQAYYEGLKDNGFFQDTESSSAAQELYADTECLRLPFMSDDDSGPFIPDRL